MKKIALALFALLLCSPAFAQTVQRQPLFAATNSWVDVGNGPIEVLPIEGSGVLYTSLGTGTGSTSGSATLLTLTAIPAVAPCVGCIISGTGITSATTVSAVNGSLLTLSAAMTVAASTAVSWGAACPTSGFPPAPGTGALGAPLNLRSTAGAVNGTATPVYSQARVCAYGAQQQGLTFVNFAIGAW